MEAVTIENWRRHYNAVRPHSSLGYLTPHEFKSKQQPSTREAVRQSSVVRRTQAGQYALKQVELGIPLEEVCRKYGVSQQTFYRWRARFGGLAPSEVKRLKEPSRKTAA